MEKKEPKFEEKIAELEKIIDALENGNIDLDESIEKYTKAMKLVKECDEKLKSIEQQVNQIVSENGKLEPFELDDEK
ncbi:MAG TPA: exodeoxyribonuclease VII small subunit [Candidatus Fimihabitans intestinipullorum]|uniref:Exodeoxyribonuclease 7 small subunit n=1 Tax=Candidatus Fimihabitans intestinipullorum TaxID=2840820 RepID=A0A9D1HV42_9BACT|nr:exodeoxyribonuclease VII small subunit [Candidatus Fimihabitans intestinipullorum]